MPFSLLDELFTDASMAAIFSGEQTINSWLATEVALARAQAAVGVISDTEARAVAEACTRDRIDIDRLWQEARNVGYPILPLVEMLNKQLPAEAGGKLHYGATTQDVMDTGLAIQLSQAFERLESLLADVCDSLEQLVRRHRSTVMAGRTHGQQAVPTTFGAKLAVFLAEFRRHRTRLREARPRACRVSLFGAAGTSAAYGPHVGQVRSHVADALALQDATIPWHTARDALAEFGFVCAALARTASRLGREVIDLSRTEIGEVQEGAGHHRGASSTMPQKANPVWSEALVGLGTTTSAAASVLLRAMEAGHERAAGEWHVEWEAVPRAAVGAASALRLGSMVLGDLVVDAAAMRRNLVADGGLLMSEAYMMRLAPTLGRQRAHDVVYEAAREVRKGDGAMGLAAAIVRIEPAAEGLIDGELAPTDYLGDVDAICTAAVGPPRLPEG